MTENERLLRLLFEEKGFSPNEAQYKAITNTEGPLFLTAGPGSGKTRVLLWRTLNLIALEGVRPDEIMLATFTEKAALQLKEGLQGLLSFASKYTHRPYDIADMYVGTLHSLCQKLLTDRRFTEGMARSRRPVIMDELDQYFFIEGSKNWDALLEAGGFDLAKKTEAYSRINEWSGLSMGKTSKTNAVKSCIAFFNRMSEEDFPDKELRLGKADETETALFKMTEKYRELLRNEPTEKVDFSCLQQRAFEYVSQQLFSASVFKHVIVDEYQDTNTIQRKIYMQLAKGNKNICVVGDDDQALYRFRGATVENLIDFENICQKEIGVRPVRIDLSTNYRSRRQIVDTYTGFMDGADWENPDKKGQFFRIQGKNITPHSTDSGTSVLLETGKKDDVTKNIVSLVKELKDAGKISDYNQCALLFPSLKTTCEKDFETAFAEAGIPFYAPRANNILCTEEFLVVLGLFAKIFKLEAKPDDARGGMKDFQLWLQEALAKANEVVLQDKNLEEFIIEKWTEIELAKRNYRLMANCCEEKKIPLTNKAYSQTTKVLASVPKLDDGVRQALTGKNLNEFLMKKNNEGKPLSVGYVLSRVTALDWTLLDLFYQLNMFGWFTKRYDKAERGEEDSALYNFGLITNYLGKYMELNGPIISGRNFQENAMGKNLFNSYIYALFRLGEGEYEDSDDPFPKGCVPFLTVHQSKGLEFPVVILASCRHNAKKVRPLDVLVRKMLAEQGSLPDMAEPLDRMDGYDTMRMFYVAMSRAKNLLVMAQFKGQGQSTWPALQDLFDKNQFSSCAQMNVAEMPEGEDKGERLAHVYTYTGDYLPYKNCPRSYMAFHKYKFVPSRSQTMFFGSLVHQSIEDLQNFINGGKR
ncbi:MAG: ATP-dependent helicase [Treponema sp.]|nr:ATP-dependent helicase [Treponema sp.]